MTSDDDEDNDDEDDTQEVEGGDRDGDDGATETDSARSSTECDLEDGLERGRIVAPNQKSRRTGPSMSTQVPAARKTRAKTAAGKINGTVAAGNIMDKAAASKPAAPSVDLAKPKDRNGAACKASWSEAELNAAWNHMARRIAHQTGSSSKKAKTMGAADFTAVAEELGTTSDQQVQKKMQVMRRDCLELIALLRTEFVICDGSKFIWKGDSHLVFGTPHSTDRSLSQFGLLQAALRGESASIPPHVLFPPRPGYGAHASQSLHPDAAYPPTPARTAGPGSRRHIAAALPLFSRGAAVRRPASPCTPYNGGL
jgi:hypothetical protein